MEYYSPWMLEHPVNKYFIYIHKNIELMFWC